MPVSRNKLILAGALFLLAVLSAAFPMLDLPSGPADAPAATEPVQTNAANTTASAEPAAAVDHYLLSLSWSPSFCLDEGADADRRQCASGATYGFIVKGLWPQSATDTIRLCETDQPRVPDDIVAQMRALMPSAGLVGGAWRRHGTCSGLSQQAYFDLTRRAYQRIKVPEQFAGVSKERSVDPQEVERAFLAANPGIKPDMIAVTCSDTRVREVRICFTPDLAFRPCHGARSECRRRQVTMPPNRAR